MTDLYHLFYRQLRLLGSTMGSKRDFPKILDAFVQGKFRAVVSREFPNSQLQEAYRFLEKSEQFGKVIVNW